MMKRRKKKNESGQAIVEFLVVISVIFTMAFLFVQIAWGIAYGHYVHYATYMAARAYLSGGETQQDQTEAASGVLRRMLKKGVGEDIFPFLAKARKGEDRDTTGPEPVPGAMIGTHPEAIGHERNRPYSWAEGVQYNYALNLFLLPLSSFMVKDGMGKQIAGGPSDNPTKAVEWKGKIPFTSDSFLGRDPTVDECYREIHRLSGDTGISRADGMDFLEDNGC
jgi:hypothetical protein